MSEFPVSQHGTVVAMGLPIRVDVSNTKGFIDCMQTQLDADKLDIVLDFEQTQAIDSTALGAIVQVFKALKAREGRLRLCAVGSGVRRVLAITRVDHVLSIFDTLDEALLACSAGN